VIKQLICHFKLDYQWLKGQLKVDANVLFADELKKLIPYIEDELVILNNTGIQVTRKGELLIHSICMLFDEYLASPVHQIRYSNVI
jgi:oxygen-independent coproporphyrinogen-3 oxidase